jgi:DNA-binding response OmpR family regulator
MAKILLVEDDAALAEMICNWLEMERHSVEHTDDGEDGASRVKHYQYDLIILDWDLPNVTGIEICKQYRSAGGHTPVLMLTGHSVITDKETGFDAGADDYLTKPFHMRELNARLRALMRRPAAFTGKVLKARDIELDSAGRSVTRSGQAIHFKPKEFDLLEFLLRHKNEPFSPEALISRLWHDDEDASVDSVRVHINRLRTKLEKEGEEPLIQTIRGTGYVLKE